jgi:hypothetical protein
MGVQDTFKRLLDTVKLRTAQVKQLSAERAALRNQNLTLLEIERELGDKVRALQEKVTAVELRTDEEMVVRQKKWVHDYIKNHLTQYDIEEARKILLGDYSVTKKRESGP